MGKRIKKVPVPRPEPITPLQCEEAARSLVDRGLASPTILIGVPRLPWWEERRHG